jgi:hypothetical protein
MELGFAQMRAAAELARRQNDGLAMFRAMPEQMPVFLSKSSELGIWGGNRCLAEGTLVATPSGPVPIESIKPGDMVYSEIGEPIRVIKVFDNGPKACVQIKHRHRAMVECSEDHLFLTKRFRKGTRLRPARSIRQKDMQIRRVEVNCPLGRVHEPHAYAIGALLGDGCSRQKTRELQISSGSPAVPNAVASIVGGVARRLSSGNYSYGLAAKTCNHYEEWCRGRYAHEKTVDINVVRSWNRQSLLAFVAGVLDTDGCIRVNEYGNVTICCEMQARPVIECLQYAFLALWQADVPVYTNNRKKFVNGPTYTIRMGSNVHTKRALRDLDPYLVSEHKKWKSEYEHLVSTRSQRDWVAANAGHDRRVVNTYDIHVASDTNLYLLANGLVTHNSGKSTSAAVKFAAVARAKPVYGSDGQVFEQRLPHQQGRKLTMWIVGLQLNHIGQTIHRVLFRPGLYKIIRDEATQAWRAYDPVKDAGRSGVKPSFPLIPWSEVKEVSWANKASRQFEYISLEWADIYAFASTSDVKQGDPVDYIWIDERIAIPGHYAEWQARLSDTKGRIVWSSMPRVDNWAMLRLNQRAEEQEQEVQTGERQKVDVEVIRLRFSNNPHIDSEEKRKRLEGWNEEERKQRDEGLFLTDSVKIYPTFDPNLHRAIYRYPEQDDAISRILRERNGEPPSDWTREWVLDPGTAKPAVLLCAVPPPELWVNNEPFFIPYKEIYRPRTDAGPLMEMVKHAAGGYRFRRAIIDLKASRQTPMGFTMSIGQNYSNHLKRINFQSDETGFGFTPGETDIQVRWQIVENALRVRPSGVPQLRIVAEGCPNLMQQMERNLRATELGVEGVQIVLEKPAKGQKDDLRNCLEYWLSRGPTWVEPQETAIDRDGPIAGVMDRIKALFPNRTPVSTGVHCGPGAASRKA